MATLTIEAMLSARLTAREKGSLNADSKKLRQIDTRGQIRRLIEVLGQHGGEDFNYRSGGP